VPAQRCRCLFASMVLMLLLLSAATAAASAATGGTTAAWDADDGDLALLSRRRSSQGGELAEGAQPRSAFVTVAQDSSGVWWFERGGQRFLSAGVSNLNDGGLDDGVGDVLGAPCRAQQNTSLCGDTNNWDMRLNYSPYFNVTQALFNGSAAQWAEDAAARLESWHFNTISGYSSSLAERAVAHRGNMFYNRLLMFATRFAEPSGTPLQQSTAGGCFGADVFSAEFETSSDTYAQANVAPRANDSALLGWHFEKVK
jgi:hypothetical protein